VLRNPKENTIWKFISIPITIVDPLTVNSDKVGYSIVDYICPVEVNLGYTFLPSGQVSPTITKYAKKDIPDQYAKKIHT